MACFAVWDATIASWNARSGTLLLQHCLRWKCVKTKINSLRFVLLQLKIQSMCTGISVMIDLTWHVNLALSDSSIPSTAQMVSTCKALLLFLSNLVIRIFCILTWSGMRAMAGWQQGESQKKWDDCTNGGKRGWFLLSFPYMCQYLLSKGGCWCSWSWFVVAEAETLAQREASSWVGERERVVQWLSRSWWKVGGKRSWESH